MEQELLSLIKAQKGQLDAIQKSVDKMRKFFMWTLIITLVVTILPAIGLLFEIPKLLSIYSSVGAF